MNADRDGLARAVEALVMVADRPIATDLLAALTEAPPDQVDEVCAELAAGYEVDGRGFILTRVAGGWRYQSHPDLAPLVERFVLEGQSSRLSSAALETLAVVAYKQPISRAQVAAIRGVNVDGVMRTLEQRGYIAEVARDPGPGQATLFGTTEVFLEKLGLDHLDDLPDLSGFVPDAEIVEVLEQGLRPGGGTDRREPGPPVPDGAPVTEPEPEGPQPAAVHAGDSEAPSPSPSGPESDPLARLDETTARLDALVDEVRGRMQAAEDAVAAREAPEPEADGDPEAEPDGDPEVDGDAEVDGDDTARPDERPDDVDADGG